MTDVDHHTRWWRLVLLAVLVVGLFVVARVTGLNAYLSTERIRALTAAAGFWGPIAFVLIFCVGELVHVPGAVFVAAAVVAYGRATGGVLAFVGELAAVSVSFVVVRTIGGKPLAAIRFSLARAFSQLPAWHRTWATRSDQRARASLRSASPMRGERPSCTQRRKVVTR